MCHCVCVCGCLGACIIYIYVVCECKHVITDLDFLWIAIVREGVFCVQKTTCLFCVFETPVFMEEFDRYFLA